MTTIVCGKKNNVECDIISKTVVVTGKAGFIDSNFNINSVDLDVTEENESLLQAGKGEKSNGNSVVQSKF